MKTRLQRFLADCGVASRRECEAMIQDGRVRVNGTVRTEMPVMIEPDEDVVTIDDETVAVTAKTAKPELRAQEKAYFLLNKPKGILVTNSDPSGRKTVGELMKDVGVRVFPVGRLDMDARGALIMTNDGELANRLTHPRYGVEKIYIVEVDGRIGHEDLEKIKRGMWLAPTKQAIEAKRAADGAAGRAFASKTEPFKVKVVGRERGRSILELKMSEAKNSDIRRVMARLGHTVRDLNRVAIAGKLTLKGLDVGEHRALTAAEVKWLYHAASPEFHAKEQAATQSWYEQKELEKERKRLKRDAVTATAEGVKRSQMPVPRAEKSEEKIRLRPERKGKKPFVPPTGRNAGKALGGNFIGKQRVEREKLAAPREEEFEQQPPLHEDVETIKGEVRAVHPLGDAAREDD